VGCRLRRMAHAFTTVKPLYYSAKQQRAVAGAEPGVGEIWTKKRPVQPAFLFTASSAARH
jgi:hypothetical protein